MGIYEKDYDLARVAGKITGLLGGGIGLYKMLAQKGMTSLIGVGKAKGFRNLGYTGLAEIGLDWAYNKDGATFILAGLMDAEPNRILSGIEAFTIGTSLNLGIDFAALIKGKTQRKAMLMAADKLNIERSKLLSALEKRGDKKFVEDVEAVLREEPIDIDLPGNIKLGPLAPADAAVIKDVAITASADAWARIDLLRGDTGGFAVDRFTHSIQTATRAHRDGKDEEYVVCALLHDIGDTIASANHADLAATMLEPFVSEKNYWIVKHHGIFQGYYFFEHLGLDKNMRDQFKGHEFWNDCAEFCSKYDQNSFDPEYENMDIKEFIPMVHNVFAKPRNSIYKKRDY